MKLCFEVVLLFTYEYSFVSMQTLYLNILVHFIVAGDKFAVNALLCNTHYFYIVNVTGNSAAHMECIRDFRLLPQYYAVSSGNPLPLIVG
jgi:hypothetical protein